MRSFTALNGVVLLLVLVGCGGPPHPSSRAAPTGPSAAPVDSGTPSATATSSEDPDLATLLAAADESVATGSAGMIFSVELLGSSLGPEAQLLHGRGHASFAEPLRMDMDVTFVTGDLGRMELIVTDEVLLIRGPSFESMVPPGKWLGVNLDSTDAMSTAFASTVSGPTDTSLGLYYVYGAGGDVRSEPGGAIGGKSTIKYEARLRLEDARDRIPAIAREPLEDNIAELRVAGVSRELDAVIFVDTDGLVSRAIYEYELGPNMGGGTMAATYTFQDYGAPLDVRLPGPSSIVYVEDLQTVEPEATP